LSNDVDFKNAKHYKETITVWHHGEQIGSGVMKRFDKEAVVLNDGAYYMRGYCDFVFV
jgi:hypothetical protein